MHTITTVVTPASASAKIFIDRATVKSALRISGSDSDDWLDFLRTWASDEIAKYVNRVLAVETVTDEFWRRGDWLLDTVLAPLQLTRWPIIASGVASVVEDGVTLVDGTDYRVNYQKGQLLRIDTNGWPRPWYARAVSVTYSAGYSPMESPIVDAALRMITARNAARGRDPSLKQESIPGIREAQWWIATGSEAGNMTPDVIDILDKYRVPAAV